LTTIEVEGSPIAKLLSIRPDPASVRVGDYVVWILVLHDAQPYEVRWEIYFHATTPFRGLAGPYAVTPTGPARHP
jgi:hypothetical protein